MDLFFVLSGFLITGILFESKGSPHYFRRFYVRRALRIFPLYYGVLFFFFVVLPFLSNANQPASGAASSNQIWLWLYGTNFLQGWERSYTPLSGFAHFWSLAVEEHFYLLWPFVIYFFNRRSGIIVCVCCILTAIISRTLAVYWGNNAVAAYVLTPCRMDGLATGGLLSLVVRGSDGITTIGRWSSRATLLCIVVLAGVYGWKRNLTQMDAFLLIWRPTLFSATFGMALIWAITTNPVTFVGRCWNNPILCFFGKYSYGLYVFHELLHPLYKHFFGPDLLSGQLGSVFMGKLLFVLLAIGASLAVALLSWHLFEKYFLRLKDIFAGMPALSKHGTSGVVGMRRPSDLSPRK